MLEEFSFLINIIKAFIVLALLGIGLGTVALLAAFIIDLKGVREEENRFSTTIGNALMVLHTIFEPSRKPQTEQVIWVKKRKTPVEKKMTGLTESFYDEICIKGYRNLRNKRFVRKL